MNVIAHTKPMAKPTITCAKECCLRIGIFFFFFVFMYKADILQYLVVPIQSSHNFAGGYIGLEHSVDSAQAARCAVQTGIVLLLHLFNVGQVLGAVQNIPFFTFLETFTDTAVCMQVQPHTIAVGQKAAVAHDERLKFHAGYMVGKGLQFFH